MENSLHCKYEKNKIKIEHENIARVRKCLFVLYYRYKKDKWKRGRGKREVENEEGEKRRGKGRTRNSVWKSEDVHGDKYILLIVQ